MNLVNVVSCILLFHLSVDTFLYFNLPLSSVLNTLHDTTVKDEQCLFQQLGTRCQFHQRFYVRIFRANIVSAAFLVTCT